MVNAGRGRRRISDPRCPERRHLPDGHLFTADRGQRHRVPTARCIGTPPSAVEGSAAPGFGGGAGAAARAARSAARAASPAELANPAGGTTNPAGGTAGPTADGQSGGGVGDSRWRYCDLAGGVAASPTGGTVNLTGGAATEVLHLDGGRSTRGVITSTGGVSSRGRTTSSPSVRKDGGRSDCPSCCGDARARAVGLAALLLLRRRRSSARWK